MECCCAGVDGCEWCRVWGRLTCCGVNVLKGVQCRKYAGDDWDVHGCCV